MSLFDALKDTTNGYASALNAGSYTFEPISKTETTEEPPSVSLYNLLDHTAEDLQVMVHAAETMLRNMEPVKEAFPKFYPSCIAWKRIFEQARIEVIMKEAAVQGDKDSEGN